MNKTRLTEAEQQELLLRLKRNYTYDAEHGRLVNKRTGKAPKGKLNTAGYTRIDLRYNGTVIHVILHRAIFAFCHDRWPVQQIDHVNGCPADNRIENLREVNNQENHLNMVHPWKPNRDTGLPGVWKMREKHFGIRIQGKAFTFRDPYEAFYYQTLLGRMYDERPAA